MSPRIFSAVLSLLPVLAAADVLPSVVSINLCSDQVVLSVADPEQIRSVSWLSADPEESMLAGEARRYPLNYGSAEEILRFAPDVVIAGMYTGTFTRQLLRELGYRVVDLAPEDSIADIERNLRVVGAALERTARAEELIRDMQATVVRLAASRRGEPVPAVAIRPGGFTVGAGTLAEELMHLAGLSNVAAERGLDRWGSLSMETLLRSAPSLLIYTGYRREERSLANVVLEHPALVRLGRDTATATVAAKYWACGLPQSLASVELLQSAVQHTAP